MSAVIVIPAIVLILLIIILIIRLVVTYKVVDDLESTAASLKGEIRTLKMDIIGHEFVNNELRASIQRRESLLESIKFTANIPNKGWTPTEFKLGAGKCGKTVTQLVFTEQPKGYKLLQYHSDGSVKTFEYLKVDISGRIERAYKPEQTDFV